MFRKILLCILIISSVLWTAFIFSNSLANAEKSTEQSSNVTEIVNNIASSVGIEEKIKESTVRSMAHFSEFAVLALLLSSTAATAVWNVFSSKLHFSLLSISASVPACFLLACVDELLQKFSDGRACDFVDVMLDTAGALCGFAFFALTYIIFILIRKKAKNSKDMKTD